MPTPPKIVSLADRLANGTAPPMPVKDSSELLTAPHEVTVATRAARANLYTDAANEALFMRPGQWLTRGLVFFDNRGLDGTVNGLGAGLGGSSSRLRRTQTGFVRSYALSMLVGTVSVLVVLMAVRYV